jgi:hypothetical protein
MNRRQPDIQGQAGRAWKLNIQTAKDHTGLVSYLLNAPGSHLLWTWYTVCLIHLRPADGIPPANIHVPGAQHELLILAIDPTRCPEPDPDFDFSTGRSYPWLHPPNLCEQFVVNSDEDAVKLTEGMVKAFCLGFSSPDDDFRTHMRALIGNTAEHMRLGGHPK